MTITLLLLLLAAGVLGVPPAQLEAPGFDTLTRLITQPGEQARELQAALVNISRESDAATATAAADVAVQVVEQVAASLAARAGVDVDTLFPMRRVMLQTAGRTHLASSSSSSSSKTVGIGSGSVDGAAAGAAGVEGQAAKLAGNGSSSNGSSYGRSSRSYDSSSNSSINSTNGSSSNPAVAAVAVAAGPAALTTVTNGRTLNMRQL